MAAMTGSASRAEGAVPAVRAVGLSRRFGRRWALRELGLTVAPGTALALVGPNGAGKTTLLKVLATLLRPTHGEAEIFGHSVRSGWGEIRRRTGFLTATGFLYDELTATENLRFAAMMAGERPAPEQLAAALERVDLAEAAEVRVRAFSTGMRRRLELARLLLRPVELALMDEPFISLDTSGIALVSGVLAELKSQGRTVIFASHHHADALRAADLVALLDRGRLEAFGPPDRLRGRLGLGAASADRPEADAPPADGPPRDAPGADGPSEDLPDGERAG